MANSVCMDAFPCMDDVMEGFLDNVDLNQLDTVELGDLSDAILENPMEYVDGISDSDSGISVAAEKNGSLTPGVSLRDGTDSLRVDSPFPISTQSDCVLTDAVGPVIHTPNPNTTPLNKETIISCSSSKPEMHFKNPVRIIRLACSGSERSTKIQISNSQPVAVRKVLPVQSVNGALGSTSTGMVSKPFLTGSIKLLPPKNSTTVLQLHESNINVPCKKMEDSRKSNSSTSTVPDTVEMGAFLDDYDPVIYSDASLEQHLLQNTNGDVLQHFQTKLRPSQTLDQSSLSPSSPSYLGSCDTFSAGDCILTRAHLERIRKKQERMIKNRHAASMSRLRKKEYLERLEMRYEQLKRENHHLWRQNEEWRARCLQLEQALNNLQSQLSECTNSLDPPDSWNGTDQLDSCFSTKPETQVKSSPSILELKCERLSPCQSVATGSPVRTVSINYPSTPATTSSTIMRPISRASLCALYSKNPAPSNNETAGFIRDTTPQTQPERAPTNRKTVLNNVIYPGKTGVLGSTQQLPTRPNLISLGGIISRHRASNLPTSRSKLIATTSLLTMVCLFSLNLLIMPLNPVGLAGSSTGSELVSAPATVRRWDSPRTHFGDRILLNVQSPEDEQQLNSASSRRTKCKSSDLEFDCEEEPPLSFDANQTRLDEPVEMLLGWIEEHELSKVALPFPNRGQKQAQHGYGPEVQKPKVTLSNIQPVSNIGPSNGSGRLKVINVKPIDPSPSPSTRSRPSTDDDSSKNDVDTSSADNQPSASSRSISKVWTALDPIRAPQPLITRPSSTAVSERGVQPFHPRLWDPDDLITAAGRQNGTVYVILTHLDHVQLHPINPTDRNTTRKITLIVPAHPLETAAHGNHKPLGVDARFSMLQVDCELLNVSLIQPLQATAARNPEET